MPRKIVFGGGWEKVVFAKSVFLIAKHYLCLEGKKKGIFININCFGEIVFFRFVKSIKHYKVKGFSRQKLCSAANIIFIAFSAKHKHSFCREKGGNCTKRKFTKNSGLGFNVQKMSFFIFFVLFFFVIWVSLVLERAQKGHSLAIVEFFVKKFPKNPFLQYFSSCLSYFDFVFPLKLPFLLFLFHHQRLLRNIPFLFKHFPSFLNFASFLQTTSLTSPFANPTCFHVWLFGSSVVVIIFDY